MVLKVCPVCRASRRVRIGDQVYVCPQCNGTGGVPLGFPPPDNAPIVIRGGQSRAAEHIAARKAVRLVPPRGRVR